MGEVSLNIRIPPHLSSRSRASTECSTPLPSHPYPLPDDGTPRCTQKKTRISCRGIRGVQRAKDLFPPFPPRDGPRSRASVPRGRQRAPLDGRARSGARVHLMRGGERGERGRDENLTDAPGGECTAGTPHVSEGAYAGCGGGGCGAGDADGGGSSSCNPRRHSSAWTAAPGVGAEREKMSRAKPVAVQKTTASRMLTPAWES